MKVRVRFSKTGPIRFTGHLDFMRSFQKAVKKSGLDAVYTTGFNPHMLLGFAAPLGVGEETTGDYADIEFAWRDPGDLTVQDAYRLKDIGLDNERLPDPPSSAELIRILNGSMPPGVHVNGAARIGQTRSSKAMALVRYASWQLCLADSFLPGLSPEQFRAAVEDLASEEHLMIVKKTKTSEKEVDIRPMILELRAGGDSFPAHITEPAFEKRRVLTLTASAGSTENLKPGAVMDAFCRSVGMPYSSTGYRTVRTEAYDAEMHTLLSLGTDF